MKKFFILAVILCFTFTLTACVNETGGASDGNETYGDTKAGDETYGNSDIGGDGQRGGNDTEDAGGVIIVYFSATGNTGKIAEYIADITKGATFELIPQNPYSSADLKYNDSNSRVSKEYRDQSLRNVPLVKATPDGWETYQTVFVGYPIWWGGASWVLNGFVTANDFTGKTVIPFCTSASSPIGSSDTQLKNMAGTGNWKDGKRFSPSSSKGDVEEWVNGLNG